MNSNIQTIKSILSDECCAVSGSPTITTFKIEENHISASLKKILITEVDSNYLIFFPDKGSVLNTGKGKRRTSLVSPLIDRNNSVGAQCACDAVIIHEYDGNYKIAYIDLKSGNTQGVATQFKSTKCFVDFLLSIAREFKGINVNCIEARFIALCEKARIINKMPTDIRALGGLGRSPTAYKRKKVTNGQIISATHIIQ